MDRMSKSSYARIFDEHAEAMKQKREEMASTFVCNDCHTIMIYCEISVEKTIPKCPRCGKLMTEKHINTNGKRIEINITISNHDIRGPVILVRTSDEKTGTFVGKNAFAALTNFFASIMYFRR